MSLLDELYLCIKTRSYDFPKIYPHYIYLTRYLIEHNEASVDISKGLIDDLKEGKQYMDYLIDHHIFTYDDLYKNTFESDKVFDELAVRYEKFREIYDKLKGKKSKSK